MLRPEPRSERLQWAVAHEIGEHLAAPLYDRLGVNPEELSFGERERTANIVATRLLLPTKWFERDARADAWDLPSLKRRYSTASHELIARRMLDCDAPATITIVDQGRITFRGGNHGRRAPPLAEIERSAQRIAAETGRPCTQCDSRQTVRAWPIHEGAWRREILRTEPFDAYATADEDPFVDEPI